jgi:uncharacterized membrane protein YqjE
MAEPGERGGGPFASVGRALRTVLAVVQNRLELLQVEFREERWRFFNALLLAGLVLLLATLTLLTATVLIVAVCVSEGRLDVIVGLTVVYLVATLVGGWRLRSKLKSWAPFSATLSEFKKDKACWDEKS